MIEIHNPVMKLIGQNTHAENPDEKNLKNKKITCVPRLFSHCINLTRGYPVK